MNLTRIAGDPETAQAWGELHKILFFCNGDSSFPSPTANLVSTGEEISMGNGHLDSGTSSFRLKQFLVGNRLSSEMASHERIPKWKALAVLSSDALSSVAYATEEVLIPLSLFATAAVAWSLPIALAIAFLLLIVTMSYQQTIDAYPSGGGAYIVSRENLGTNFGLVAGAALLIDYILTVAVSVASGVENIASAFPWMHEHKVLIGILIILAITIANLRGLRESASIFALPTYLFIGSFVVMIVVGLFRIATGDIPAAAPIVHETYPAIPLFLLLRAFSSGCSALTGIEAISNGIPVFKEPSQRNAKITMVWMSLILGGFFLGITVLSHLLGIIPQEGETTISMLASKVFGHSIFYYVVQASTALILVLAANTSYADFPRLASLLAKDGFLPRQFSSLGDRLVFSNGILGLFVVSSLLIIIFNGDTHALIPLYAVGVFLSFTLSQSGMILHHWKLRQKGWVHSMAFNLAGALTTLVVLLVIATTKFLTGAWIVIVLIPLIVLAFLQVKKHYSYVAKKLGRLPLQLLQSRALGDHYALIPVSGVHPGVVNAINYAQSISKNVEACYVEINPDATNRTQEQWKQTFPTVPLRVLSSPYRSTIEPIIDYVDEVTLNHPDKTITVIIPEFVTKRWYHKLLHNQTALVLYAALRSKKKVVVTSIRYHL